MLDYSLQSAIVYNYVRAGQQEPTADSCYYSTQEEPKITGGQQQHIILVPLRAQQDTPSSVAVSQLPPNVSSGATKPSQQTFDRRQTPVLPRRMDKNRQLAEFLSSADGSNLSSSSVSGGSSIQTPVIGNSSKDSSLSDDVRNVTSGQLASSDLEIDHDDCSVKSTPGFVNQKTLCSSETNLAATLPRHQPHRRHHGNVAEVQLACTSTTSAAEYVQQMRRRSRSADNLTKLSRQQKQDVWSAVEIDINGQQSVSSKPLHGKLRSRSALGQQIVEGVPPAFSALRLRPFRQQMNSVVVSSLNFFIQYICD
jgi:hypothetical protein